MAWSGSPPNQTYGRTDGTYSGASTHQQNEANGGAMTSAMWDTHNQDMATAINLTLKKDGGNKPTANIDWGGFGITNDPYSLSRPMRNVTAYSLATSGWTRSVSGPRP